jgi:dUTP pyrophosphatase
MLQLKFKQVHPEAQLPKRSTEDAACIDIRCILPDEATTGYIALLPNRAVTLHTGWEVEVPKGYVLTVFSRSGHGFKNDVRLSNGTGIIDADYRGEVMVRVRNDGHQIFEIRSGDRIAQAMLEILPAFEIVQVDELTPTKRGKGGLGHTGVS